VHYYFNYAAQPAIVAYPHGAGRELLSGAAVRQGQPLQLAAWGMQIVEEK
jgi:beta-galactosidase